MTQNNQKKLNLFVITDTYKAIGIIEGYEQIPEGVSEYTAHIQAWQYLIDTGIVWQLQGMYGRTARDLIARGTCKARGEK